MTDGTDREGAPLRILMLEDNPIDAELNEYELRKGGMSFESRRVETREGFERELEEFRPNIILSDFELPAFDGISALLVAQSHSPDVPFIFVTGIMGEEMAIDFLKRGATDYVLKDRLSRLVPAVKRAMEEVDERLERWRAQLALRESEERYRTIVDSTGTAMFTMDEHGTISFVNNEFERMTGWSAAEVEGKVRAADLLVKSPVESESLMRYHAEVLEGGTGSPLRFEIPVLSRADEELSLLASMALLPGTKTSIVSLIDITRERSYEEELKDRAERLSEFLAVASHELRQPATIIKGYTATLKEYEGKLPSGMVQDIYATMDSSADRLARIVEELMDVSRIEKQEVLLTRETARVDSLIAEAIAGLKSRGATNDFRVKIVGSPLEVNVDTEKFGQLLTILLENAVHYSPAGSRIDIAAGKVPEDVLEMRVMDRGPGVPKEAEEKIFERFFQVDDVLHHSKPGVGLGLYIARHIVAGHGGALGYSQRKGGGSVFHFTLPA
ncbi:MAG: sensor histidine kinase [Candidatus Geothermincolia bacterium]